MGLLDIFLSKEKRDERSRARNAARAINKFAQSADRFKAMETLANDGSEDALYGLLRRFGMMYDKSIEDAVKAGMKSYDQNVTESNLKAGTVYVLDLVEAEKRGIYASDRGGR